MAIPCLRRLLLLSVLSVVSLIAVSRVLASSCPGDSSNDGVVTVDEIILAVNADLNGCAAVAAPSQLLKTGQTACDEGAGTLAACPGFPSGQDAAVGAGLPLIFTDNGDGTVGNIVTGLTWEKLSDDGSIHDWNTTYTWADASDVKITALNTPPCFAGQCDWRLPNRREMESLVDADRSAPAVDPVFNTHCAPGCTVLTCSCTQLDQYWSSTTYTDAPTFAWSVDGNLGAVNGFDKSLMYYTRAVRGGL